MLYEEINIKKFVLRVLVLCTLFYGSFGIFMYYSMVDSKNAPDDTDVYDILNEEGYFVSALAVGFSDRYPDKNMSKHILAVDGNLSVDFMRFEDIESAESKYYGELDETSSRIMKNGEVKLESKGGKSNFDFYKLETDKNYAHIMRIGETIVIAEGYVERKGEIVSIMNKLGYNIDAPIDKTGYLCSKQFANIALIFLIVTLPVCILCRKVYWVKLCEVCGKHPEEVENKKAEIFGNIMNKRIGMPSFERWMYTETSEKYTAQRLMNTYKYFAVPNFFFLILTAVFRGNGAYYMIPLAGMIIISVMLIYTVIFTVKNKLLKKCLTGNNSVIFQ